MGLSFRPDCDVIREKITGVRWLFMPIVVIISAKYIIENKGEEPYEK
jgi:hypothetical protein